MDPAALHAAVCRADADDPRLLGRRSAGDAKVQEKSRPEDSPQASAVGRSLWACAPNSVLLRTNKKKKNNNR